MQFLSHVLNVGPVSLLLCLHGEIYGKDLFWDTGHLFQKVNLWCHFEQIWKLQSFVTSFAKTGGYKYEQSFL